MVCDVMRDLTSLVTTLITLVTTLKIDSLLFSRPPPPPPSFFPPFLPLSPLTAVSIQVFMATVVMGTMETSSHSYLPACDVTFDVALQRLCRPSSLSPSSSTPPSSSLSSWDSGFSHTASRASILPLRFRELIKKSLSSFLSSSTTSSSSSSPTTSSLLTEWSFLFRGTNISSPRNPFLFSSIHLPPSTSRMHAPTYKHKQQFVQRPNNDSILVPPISNYKTNPSRSSAFEIITTQKFAVHNQMSYTGERSIFQSTATHTHATHTHATHTHATHTHATHTHATQTHATHTHATHTRTTASFNKSTISNNMKQLRKKREVKQELVQKVRNHSQQGKKGMKTRFEQAANQMKAKKQQHVQILPHFLAQGLEGRIECFFVEYDPPTSLVVWSKNSKVIEAIYDSAFPNSPGHRETNHGEDGDEGHTRRSRFKVTKTGTLVIENVTIADSGNYSCSLYSPYEKGRNEQKHFSVDVKEIPVFENEPLPVYQRLIGQSVTMTCSATGDPAPFITWNKMNGHFPPPTRTLADNGSLTIVSLQLFDQGTYECLALNAISTIATTSLLVVLDRPQQSVHNVSTSTTSNSLTVSWLPPLREEDDPDGPYIYDFVIVPSSMNPKQSAGGASTPSPGQRTFPLSDTGVSTITVHHLLPRTKYTFSIVAISTKTMKRVASHAYDVWTKDEDGQEVFDDNSNSPTSTRWLTNRNQVTSTSNPTTTRDDLHRPAPPINVEVGWHTPEKEKPPPTESKNKRQKKNDDDVEDGDEEDDAEDEEEEEEEEDEEEEEEGEDEEEGEEEEQPKEPPGLLISWLPPTNSPLPVDTYTVEYRTVGRWVPLENPVVAPITHLYWKRPSWGVVYYFRVVSTNNRTKANSKPSFVVSINTTDPMSGFVEASTTGMIGFVVGSMSVFLVLIAFTISLTRLFKKRKLKQVEKKRLKQEADEASMTVNTSVGRALDGKESPLLDVRLAVDNHVIASSSNHNSIEFTTTPILETPI